MKNKQLPFYILTLALFIGLIVPILIQDGMFMDGQLYTNVAKNLGNGIGSFWFPIADATWMMDGKATFHEHPPLVFAIQSVFFKVLGNSMYTERFYSFLTACITAFLIFLLWKEIFKNKKEMIRFSWLPLVLWIIVPVVQWTFQNNMQENTMGIFSLLAVILIIKGLNREKFSLLYISLAGAMVFLASLSKGVPGIFPIGTVGLYWLIYRKPKFYKVIFFTIIILAIPAIIYFLLIQNPSAKESLSFYLNYRLLGRVESVPTVTNRFHTIIGLLSHLLPVLIICGVLIFVFWKKSIKGWFEYKKEFLLFTFIGLSASLPLMLTMVQKDFYFSHSIPYFGIAFALLLLPGVAVLVNKIKISGSGFKIFRVISIALLAFALGFSIYQIGGQSRDKDELTDIHNLGKIIPENSTIDIEESMRDLWGPRFYLVRYFNIGTSPGTFDHNYILIQKEGDTTGIFRYQKINTETIKFDLYEKQTGKK